MKKKKSNPAPSLADFRIRFLRIMQSAYRAEPVIARILKDQCSAAKNNGAKCPCLKCTASELLWHTINDTRDRIARQTIQERNSWASKLDDAIKGTRAMEEIYVKLDNKPHLAEYMSTLRSDLEKKRLAVETAFAPPKAYGRDRDWFFVSYAKFRLESRLQTSIPNKVMADFLNAADIVVGRKPAKTKTEIYEADVDAALRRLNQRTFARVLPYYQQLLSQHYPLGSDLPRKQ